MSNRQRLHELKAFVLLCLMRLEEKDGTFNFKNAAAATGLSAETIRRYAHGKVTLAAHFESISRLGDAAGLSIELPEDKPATIKLKRRKAG